ncbi:hypothetical protein HDU82_003661 [Entophlyctis luteolus]|nr:hypothetical protein HDU82_003661 [Entophlyctis luteolus]
MPKVLTVLAFGVAACVASAALVRRSASNASIALERRDRESIDRLFSMLASCESFDAEEFAMILQRVQRSSKKKQVRNPASAKNDTLFMAACLAENIRAVRAIISNLASINPTASMGNSALALFCAEDAFGATVLHRLVEERKHEVVKSLIASDTLLQLGLTSVRHSRTQRTPLMTAVDIDDLEMVKLLIKLHADVNAKDARGMDALMISCSLCRTAISEYLLLHPSIEIDSFDLANRSSLFYACKLGDIIAVKNILVKRSSILNAPSPKVVTKKRSSPNIAQRKMNVDPIDATEEASGDGLTPVLVAIKKGHIAVLELLLEATAQTSWKGFSSSPLHLAVVSKSVEMVKFVFAKICNSAITAISAPDRNTGTTPFHIAALLHLPDILRFFLSKTSRPIESAVDDNGRSALHLALTSSSRDAAFFETVKILITSGGGTAMLNIADITGLTPLAIYKTAPASDSNTHSKILQMLETDEEIKGNNYRSPIVARNLRIDLEVRRSALGGNVSVEGFVKALLSPDSANKVVVVIGEGVYQKDAFPNGVKYSGNHIDANLCQDDIGSFYQSLHTTYGLLAREKHTTPLFHRLLVELENRKILSATYCSVVDGTIGFLQLQTPVYELDGNVLARPRCMTCGYSPNVSRESASDTNSADAFWNSVSDAVAIIDALPSGRPNNQKQFMTMLRSLCCPREGCFKGFLGPNILLNGEEREEWIDRACGGWREILSPIKQCRSAIFIGVPQDGNMARLMSAVPESSPVLIIGESIPEVFADTPVDSMAENICASVLNSGENYRFVGLKCDPDYGGIDQGLRTIAKKCEWRWE